MGAIQIFVASFTTNARQIWHADITIFATADRVRHCIYLVVDNFSRKIISWEIADVVKAEIRRVTIAKALEKVRFPDKDITLVTDGGPENNLKAFLDSLDQPVQQRLALTDVHYSNSLIEAHNKIIKYNYLYRMDIPHGEHLRKIFPSIVENFNNRPHVSLAGLTPNEAEQNLSLNKEQLRIYTAKAARERERYNRINQCSHCKD